MLKRVEPRGLMDAELFDRDFLRKLEYLSFIARRIYRGDTRGAHASMRRGTSLDFADFRAYQAGDDFRSIDWSIFTRLDRLFVRLYAEEEDLTVHVLLDASASMSFGTPRKIDYARRLAAALGYVGIGSLDRVGVTTFAAGLGGALAPRRGRAQFFHLLEYMGRIRGEAGHGHRPVAGGLRAALAKPGACHRHHATFWTNRWTATARGCARSAFHDFEVVLVHVLDREEITPRRRGRCGSRTWRAGRRSP